MNLQKSLTSGFNEGEKDARINRRSIDGSMMCVEVSGTFKTTSEGWEGTGQDGKTIFKKYGKAEKLKIIK